jgi:hypothetical protein
MQVVGRPFEEGHPGGPGRPSFRDLIDKVGSEVVEAEGIGKITRSEKLIRGAFQLAESAEENTRVAAMKFIVSHKDGAKTAVDVTSAGERIESLTDDERIVRVAALLEQARERRTGQAP